MGVQLHHGGGYELQEPAALAVCHVSSSYSSVGVMTNTVMMLWYDWRRLLPLVLVLPCIGPIVKVASMLSAIADLDLDVIGRA